ncbi:MULTISPECIES: hypothetical protein [Vibrio]|uniref:hypothetical protein n=1 Tax=Vibrio TaxID=662 RepID=UPI00280EAA6D|nr:MULTISPECIES: hypothetical protein [unclassified Vibrio]ELB2875391.1 hypothetical protein [Vibrio alginolyticus]MDW1582814.1 hypothetical protein [Vibrio sp. Vb2897]MDW1588179.1 hypothetical protein [Vibrio sp. Vb2910]MDW1597409.1 hypothetical protein [Vibrio sp. Vb2911]MDW1641075.1 hypothetical protein [Vibrio sp. Vb2896]
MSDFKRDITRILAAEAVIEIKPNAAGFHYIDLKEDGRAATLKHLKLNHIKESDTCITFDVSGDQKFKTYSPYLKSSEGLTFNKRCDFVVARYEGGIWRVYFGDLKSTRVEVSNIIKQLSSTKVFFDFILEIIKNEFGNNELIDYVPRFVCVHDNSKEPSAGVLRATTIPGNSEPSTKICNETKKQLIIMPVGVTATGKAKVSFNQFCSI